MDLAYFKRYRMEIDLAGRDLPPPSLPDGYRFLPWQPSLLEAFAEAKYLSFRGEIDANVFPCLGELAGCRRLMTEIAGSPAFCPRPPGWSSTLRGPAGGRVLRHDPGDSRLCRPGRDPERGHHADHRNGGLGTALLLQPCRGSSARPAARLPGSDGRERRRHPALSPPRFCDGQDRLQGR